MLTRKKWLRVDSITAEEVMANSVSKALDI